MLNSSLMRKLQALAPSHRIAFAASCTERLLPNYAAFSVMEQWGKPSRLRYALDQVWSHLAGVSLEEEQVRALISECEGLTPDAEDFGSFFASAALDAATALAYTLECCLDGSPETASFAGQAASDTIEAYLYFVNDPSLGVHTIDPLFDGWLQKAPLMEAEVLKQNQDLKALQAHPMLDAVFLRQLRDSANMAGIQPFKRGLVKLYTERPPH